MVIKCVRAMALIVCTNMTWAYDRAVPVSEQDVVAVFETVRARAVTDALLAFLQLFEQSEVTWHCVYARSLGIGMFMVYKTVLAFCRHACMRER